MSILFFFFRLTKCTFHKYGHSGTIEKHDALCLLALNIISEKIYVFVWFWLIILAVLTAGYMIYTIAVIAIPTLRKTMLQVCHKFFICCSQSAPKIILKCSQGGPKILPRCSLILCKFLRTLQSSQKWSKVLPKYFLCALKVPKKLPMCCQEPSKGIIISFFQKDIGCKACKVISIWKTCSAV